MVYLRTSGHPLPSLCADSGCCVPATSRVCAVCTHACAPDTSVCDGWCHPCLWCVCVTECCLEHSVRVAYVATVLGTLCASRPCVFMNSRGVAAVRRVSTRALRSFSVHVGEEVALLCPGSVTSPLRPGGHAREAREASGSPPLLPFPCEGLRGGGTLDRGGQRAEPPDHQLGALSSRLLSSRS